MHVHRDAAVGFGNNADAYEAARPVYPAVAVEHLRESLDLGPSKRVLDVGAGTGKLTRLLSGLNVVGIEPLSGMRREFAALLGSVPLVAATAEELPVASNSVAAIVCGQAFHWFDYEKALGEFNRVLCRGGGVGLLWNRRDESVSFVAELEHVMRWDVMTHYPIGFDFPGLLRDAGYNDARRARFNYLDRLSHEQLLARVATTSYIVTMERHERERVLREVATFISSLPEPVDLPYVTEVVTARRA